MPVFGNTFILTDQGPLIIDQITHDNTIRGKQVLHITKTISKYEHLIKVKENAL